MDIDKERAAFEVWAKVYFDTIKLYRRTEGENAGDYTNGMIQCVWDSWQYRATASQDTAPPAAVPAKLMLKTGDKIRITKDGTQWANEIVSDFPSTINLDPGMTVEFLEHAAVPAPDALYEAIKHGDNAHKAWLKKAIHAFYAGQPLPEYVAAAPAQAVDALAVADAARLRLAEEYERRVKSNTSEMGGNMGWARLEGAVAVVDALRAALAAQPAAPDERFFMDHGLWHDRVTGQHMWTQDQYDDHYRDGLAVGRENAELGIGALLPAAPAGELVVVRWPRGYVADACSTCYGSGIDVAGNPCPCGCLPRVLAAPVANAGQAPAVAVPTEAMLRAHSQNSDGLDPETARKDWYAMNAASPLPQQVAQTAKFQIGETVRKVKGSQWTGKVVGTYSTALTPEGYAVESSTEHGSVQIYPAAALELVEQKT